MQRNELERPSKDELIELVLRLQRPAKTWHTSSKPPSTNRKERREHAEPGGAKPGHEGHSRMLGTNPDQVVNHAPQQCPCCLALSPDLPSEAVSLRERIELSEIRPITHLPRLVAALPFGFWVSLLERGGRSVVPSAPKRDYDMTLWRPALHRAFPNARLWRVNAPSRLDTSARSATASPITNRPSHATSPPTMTASCSSPDGSRQGCGIGSPTIAECRGCPA